MHNRCCVRDQKQKEDKAREAAALKRMGLGGRQGRPGGRRRHRQAGIGPTKVECAKPKEEASASDVVTSSRTTALKSRGGASARASSQHSDRGCSEGGAKGRLARVSPHAHARPGTLWRGTGHRVFTFRLAFEVLEPLEPRALNSDAVVWWCGGVLSLCLNIDCHKCIICASFLASSSSSATSAHVAASLRVIL